MQDNRNTSCCSSQQSPSLHGTVCIDTSRILDTCRDKDCYEDTRVYLTACGEEILANSSGVRTKCAKLLGAFVGVDEVPFNAGFYQVTIRYYIEVEFEACVGVGRSQSFKGLAVLAKDVVLYGGEGRAVSFTSKGQSSYCNVCDIDTGAGNEPTAIVETVEPVVLGMKVSDCNCPCPCGGSEYSEIPEGIRDCIGEDLVINGGGARLLVSFGIFSVIRITRPAQLLVQATDYSVPDKECNGATNNDNPCALFRNMPFPISQFKGTDSRIEGAARGNNGGACGCGK